MFVEYQPSTPSSRAFSPGAMMVLISVWPVFKSLPASGAFVRAVEPLDIMPVEHRGPRPNLLELGPDLLEQRRLDHAGSSCGGVAVVLEDVPRAEDEIVERRERHYLADLRRSAFGALAEPHGSHLRERSDWLRDSLANGERAGNRRGADGAEADEHHAEPPACRSNIDWRRHETAII